MLQVNEFFKNICINSCSSQTTYILAKEQGSHRRDFYSFLQGENQTKQNQKWSIEKFHTEMRDCRKANIPTFLKYIYRT